MSDHTMNEISLPRLYILRAYYGLMAFGTLAVFWPDLVGHSDDWGIRNGAQYSLLGALSPFALLGIRYPLKMLPLIFHEFLWKALWFVFVMAPLWRHGAMTANVWTNAYACAIAIVLTPIIMPWAYVWRTYVCAPADRWR
jgi:hypothetical protein